VKDEFHIVFLQFGFLVRVCHLQLDTLAFQLELELPFSLLCVHATPCAGLRGCFAGKSGAVTRHCYIVPIGNLLKPFQATSGSGCKIPI
jgi:hypothetical protein